jgi:hypothetical protein
VHYPFTCDNAPAVHISLCTELCFLGIIVNATCLLFEVSKHEGVVRDQTSRKLSFLLVFSGLCHVISVPECLCVIMRFYLENEKMFIEVRYAELFPICVISIFRKF